MTKQTGVRMPHGLSLPNNLPLMKEEVLIKRTNSQIKARRWFDSHCRQSSCSIPKAMVVGNVECGTRWRRGKSRVRWNT